MSKKKNKDSSAASSPQIPENEGLNATDGIDLNAGLNENGLTPEQQAILERMGVQTSSKKVRKRKVLIKVLTIILLIILLLLSISFACVSYINKAGDFTVNLDRDALNQGISLSETKDFSKPTRFLSGTKVENLLDCTLSWLPDDIDDIDGSHNRSNGREFMAYTFYIKNAGKEDAGYYARLKVDSVALAADEAIRVMVIKNGERTIYAKPKVGTQNVMEDFAVDKNFLHNRVVMEYSNRDFKTGAVDKYTVVIWLEGEDPQCINDILNGEVKLSMDFNLLASDSGGEARV